MRQGDLVSPLLFCLAEDVLCRGISRTISQGGLKLIMSSRNNHAHSHIFYVDDITIYCTGKHSNIQALKKIFSDYSVICIQTFNLTKSFIDSGSINNSHLDRIISNIGFRKGSIPFNCLGIPIFKGRPKEFHLSPIFYRTIAKLSTWKGALLSMPGRLTIVKSIVQNMISYSINIYSWPMSLIRKIDQACRNFIWTGDIQNRKLSWSLGRRLANPLLMGISVFGLWWDWMKQLNSGFYGN